jgi:hypothetical protein
MKLEHIPVGITDWSEVSSSVQNGKTGTVTSRARQFGDLQLRLVEYSAGYLGDHWCSKGHIVYLISGSLIIEHQDGTQFAVQPGASYHVGDDQPSPHRAISETGATLFVLD